MKDEGVAFLIPRWSIDMGKYAPTIPRSNLTGTAWKINHKFIKKELQGFDPVYRPVAALI